MFNTCTEIDKISKVRKAAIVETGSSNISISWKKPEGDTTGYLIQYSEKTSEAENKDKKKSKRKKSIKKEEDENKLEDIPETDDIEDKNISKDKKDETKVKGDIKELEISEPDTTQANLEDLKSDVEYVIKIYTLDGDRKSDRVKLTAKTSEFFLLVTHQAVMLPALCDTAPAQYIYSKV